jgi:hypothetical protein
MSILKFLIFFSIVLISNEAVCQSMSFDNVQEEIQHVFGINQLEYNSQGIASVTYRGRTSDKYIPCEVKVKLEKGIRFFIMISYPKSFEVERMRYFERNDNYHLYKKNLETSYSTSRNSCNIDTGDCWEYDHSEVYFRKDGSSWKSNFEVGFSRDDTRGRCIADPIFSRVQ